MIIVRKLKKKKEEIQFIDLTDEKTYYGIIRPANNRITLYKCREEKAGNVNPIQPSKLINFVRSNKVLLSGDEESLKLEEFLKQNNIKHGYIDLCPFCIIKGKFSEITDKYKIYNSEICLECAIDEVKHEININEEFIEKLLRRFKDANKVIELFKSKNPLKNPELTKYDVLTGNVDDNIKNYEINELDIPDFLKEIIKNRGIDELLPVQTLSVKAGLLKNDNLLITSATSSGKTLIGELAGIKNISEKKGKFLFLVPLVALANQKYVEFKDRYEKEGYSVSLRVGTGRLSENKGGGINSSLDSDIIIGTYEGIDYLIRSGKLKDVGTVVIDEVHSINMDERGSRLDGLIGRLRYLFTCQMIYLSATVGNPEELASKLGSKLVLYNGRPVPLERHLIFTKNDYGKLNLVKDIVKQEFSSKSKYGFRGQSLIFTFSRKRAEYISNYLNTKGIKSDYYHGGMEYSKRRTVEDNFLKQKTMCVVTTAALAAGVDFAASTVVLESLAMGGDWLNPSEFQQMCGRAGRKGMHDKGKVYSLVEIGKKYHAKMENSEDEVSFKLLNSEPEEVSLEYSEDEEFEQVLAYVCSIKNYKNKVTIPDVSKVPVLGKNLGLNYVLESLSGYQMLDLQNKNINTTRYGYATSISFLYPKDAEKIRKNLHKNPLDIVVSISPFENVYIPANLKNKISKTANVNIPTRFTDAFELIKENFEKIKDKTLRDEILPWLIEFDGLIEEDIINYNSKKVLNLRINKKTPLQISKIIHDTLKLQTYSGDIYSYLETSINTLDAVERIGNIYNKKIAKESAKLKKKMENPYKN
ncbi:DEAD/DEAH box helicase [Methanococcus maripaludis]|uniref:DEAD/DEAH box helicase n=1 Tax=Methanococcus maripaludis TaxID=39152 RepID=A0A8T3W5H7_METMI|nr:DEAD/DEAH box helicase [Methanococcus maripaludis]MBG0768882.1 DEAD/DEAH box helicase [Methanococcus maripaludis]